MNRSIDRSVRTELKNLKINFEIKKLWVSRGTTTTTISQVMSGAARQRKDRKRNRKERERRMRERERERERDRERRMREWEIRQYESARERESPAGRYNENACLK